jgi:glycosyltransferase involved in cell wall biosynthesis
MVVTPYFPPEGGGLETYALNLIQQLIRNHGWRVVVATSGDHHRGVQVTDRGQLRVYRLPYQARISNTRLGLTWRRDLKRIIATEAPVLVNAHAPVPGLADLVAGLVGTTPLVVTYHGGSMRKGRWPVDAFIRLYERVPGRRLLARADWIIASSDSVRDTYLTAFRAKSSTVTPGVDTERFSPAAFPARDRVLFVGGLNRSDRHKGLDVLLSAVAILAPDRPRLSLDVVGSGNDLAHCEMRCRVLGIDDRVRFLGRRAHQDLADVYRTATVVALPTSNDSFPMVLMEAMASAVPVVSTAVGGIPQLVEDGEHGFLVSPEDHRGLADRLGHILDDPMTALRFGQAARQKAHHSLSWGGQVDRTQSILTSVLTERRGDRRRRVAVVAPFFHPKIGGLEQYAYQIARGLNDRDDYEIVVLTSNHEHRRTTVEVIDGLTVFRFPAWTKLSNTPVSPIWPWRLRRAMSDNLIDLVHAHTPVPGMAEAAALACGQRPLVVTYHAGSMLKNRRGPDIVIRFYEERILPLLLRRADAVVSVSPSVSSRLVARSLSRPFLVPPGVDDERFVPALTGERGQVDPTILFAGRIERSSAWKGIGCLLQAFALVLEECPTAQLVLVGGGDAVEEHARTVARLGVQDRVRFRGPLWGADLVAAYQQASVVVLPSTTEAESFGMSLVEGMACAKPVIGSNIGGIPYVVSDGNNGVLVDPGDPRQLASACVRLLQNTELATGMGQRGYEMVRSSYRWGSRIDSYDSIFAGLPNND